jgi:hypothetical protein
MREEQQGKEGQEMARSRRRRSRSRSRRRLGGGKED